MSSSRNTDFQEVSVCALPFEREQCPLSGASMAPDCWGEPNLPSEIIVAVIDERISVALLTVGTAISTRQVLSEAVVYGA